MDSAVFSMGIPLRSNTLYKADREVYDFTEKDCTVSRNRALVNYFYMHAQEYAFAVLGENLENVELDFGGAELRLHGMLSPMAFHNCKNLKISNVTLSYDRPLFSEGTVLAVGADWAKVHFGEAFPVRCEKGRIIPYAPEWEDDHLGERQMFFQFFDAGTGDGCGITLGIVTPQMAPDQDTCFNPVQYTAEECDGDVIFRVVGEQALPDAWQAGRILVIEHGGREHSAVVLNSCENVILENVRLLNTNGMGILPLHTKNLTISGLLLRRDEKSTGVIANSADAIHAISCSGDFLVQDSIMEGCIDDAVNVHGQYQVLLEKEDRTMIAEIKAYGVLQYSNLADIGEEMIFYRGNTMEPLGKAIITEKEILDERRCRYTLDRPVPAEAGDRFDNLTCQCNLTFRRCLFAKTNTHIRLQTSGTLLMQDCVTELPILLTGDTNFWYESSPCLNLQIRNTYFTEPKANIRGIPEFEPTQDAPYYHRHLRVEDCMFTCSTPLSMRQCDDIVFLRNRNVTGEKMLLDLTDCGGLRTDMD